MARLTRFAGRTMTAGGVLVAATVWCGPALAWTGVISWPTYDRTGPDKAYEVLNELDRGVVVEVLSCDGGWCKVEADRATAYVEQALIAQQEAPTPQPVPQVASDACFESHETGYGKGETWRYCPK